MLEKSSASTLTLIFLSCQDKKMRAMKTYYTLSWLHRFPCFPIAFRFRTTNVQFLEILLSKFFQDFPEISLNYLDSKLILFKTVFSIKDDMKFNLFEHKRASNGLKFTKTYKKLKIMLGHNNNFR